MTATRIPNPPDSRMGPGLATALRDRMLALDRITRRVQRRPALGLAMCALLLAVQISPWWYAASDGALYLTMARSYVSAEGGAALGRGTPPGYALLISPVLLLGERPFLALSVAHWLIALALIGGVYVWARRLCPRAALWMTALTAANVSVCYYYRRTLKELVFMAVVMWAVNAWNALGASQTRGQFLRRMAAVAGLLGAAILIRYSAVVLVVGFALAVRTSPQQNVSRRRAAVGLVVLAAVVLGLSLLAHGANNLRVLLGSDDASTLLEGLRLWIAAVPRICTPGMFKAYAAKGEWLDWNIALGVLLAIVIVAGWRRAARHRLDALMLTLPIYAGLYVVWPFDQGARFMTSMVPVVIACFWFAMDRLPRIRSLVMVGCLAAHLSASFGYWLMIDAPRAAAWHGQWPHLDRIAGQVDLAEGRVCCPKLLNEARCMLAVCLNDPSALVPDQYGIDADRAAWAVHPRSAAIPRGWHTVASAGAYRLLQPDRRTAGRD